MPMIGWLLYTVKFFLRTCKCTGILQDHGSRVEILSQSLLPFLQLAPFEGIPSRGSRELGISGIDWGHKAWGDWELIISRINVAHRCETGSRHNGGTKGTRMNSSLEPRLRARVQLPGSFHGPPHPGEHFFKYHTVASFSKSSTYASAAPANANATEAASTVTVCPSVPGHGHPTVLAEAAILS